MGIWLYSTKIEQTVWDFVCQIWFGGITPTNHFMGILYDIMGYHIKPPCTNFIWVCPKKWNHKSMDIPLLIIIFAHIAVSWGIHHFWIRQCGSRNETHGTPWNLWKERCW
jgi:hypothetical protein